MVLCDTTADKNCLRTEAAIRQILKFSLYFFLLYFRTAQWHDTYRKSIRRLPCDNGRPKDMIGGFMAVFLRSMVQNSLQAPSTLHDLLKKTNQGTY